MMKPKISKTVADILLFIAFLLLVVWCFSGCKSVEKYKASPQYPADCAKDFPPQYIPGKPDTVTLAGVTIDCDSVIAANSTPKAPEASTSGTANPNPTTPKAPTNRVTCPPSHTITIVDTVVSTAAIEACQRTLYEERAFYQKQIDKMQNDADRLQGKFSRRTKQRNWLFLIVAAAALYSQRHRIIKLFA